MKAILPFLYCIIAVISLRFACVSSEGVQCGQPGRPVNGTVSPSGRTYFPGEKVTYSCLEGFVLFGEEGRTCLKNGTWSGDVPLCDFNLAKGKRSLQSATLWSYVPSLAVDGNKGTCSFTPKGPDSRWWQVHLGHKYNVLTIGVTISPGSFQEFTIFVIELLSNNKALYKPCTEFKGVFQTHKGLFKCNDGLGHPGQYVYIRDDRKEEEYFGLCEVEVFAFRERIPCGDPEVPISGIVKREGEDRAVYSCDSGFTLQGDSILTCSSKGEWQGHAPQCDEVRCPAPPHIDNGYIEIGNPKGEYVYGTVAKYGCSPGFVLRGPETRECGGEGTWMEEAPICQGISCGSPPTFENADYTFFNDSTTHATGIVVYTCVDGFKRHPESEDTVTTCLDTGMWRSVNVTCIPIVNKLNFVVRDPEGDSLDLIIPTPPQVNDTQGLVVSLAVIAGILALGMLIFGVLLIKKKFLTSFGSLNPLVGRGDGSKKSSRSETSVDSVEAASPPYVEPLGKPQSIFNTNILQGLASREYRTRLNQAEDSGSSSNSSNGLEPPYEQVRSDHSYETLKKKSLSKLSGADTPSSQDTNYESVLDDKVSVGYETVASPKEPGYETIANPRDHGYETVANAKETVCPGYETVGGEEVTEPGYEVVKNDSRTIHGYETLKPKVPPRDKAREASVPDILLNLSIQETETKKPRGEASANLGTAPVPSDILALYAKVDKTKKKRRPKTTSPSEVGPTNNHQSGDLVLETRTLEAHSKHRLKDTFKFNTLSHQEELSKGINTSPDVNTSLSPSGTLLRPLPPLPM